MLAVCIALITFVLMEPIGAAVHHWAGHGIGKKWHASHHRPPRGRFESNDLIPVVSAVVTIAMFAVGVSVSALWWLVPIAVGATCYGAAYMFVHDVVIHQRLPFVKLPPGFGRYWREAHNVHHVFGKEPYGFLAPIVPADLRERASRPDAPLPDRITRPAGGTANQRAASTSRV